MKIRTDFVTNSSSSSFVTYRISNSEFCKYLTEQMKKNDFTYDEEFIDRFPYKISIESDSLEVYMNCWCDEPLLNDNDTYIRSEKKHDIEMMSEKFLEIMGEIIPFEKVDEPEKLYDALVNDIENRRFECDLEEGMTDCM